MGVGIGKKLYNRPRNSRSFFDSSLGRNNEDFGAETKLTSHIRYINEEDHRPVVMERQEQKQPVGYDPNVYSKIR